MYKQTTVTGATAGAIVQLGFVPEKIVITERVSMNQTVWLATNPADAILTTASTGVRTAVGAAPVTLIDGSDKTNYTTSSFGFMIPATTLANSLVAEIEAYRQDQV